jgi:predicted enzyme related to lactoylglutathione lyase
MRVTETFFSIEVADMARATAFYANALGATVSFPSAQWSSLHVAGVRLGLFQHAAQRGARTGLHFAVDDLDAALSAITEAGGQVVLTPREVAPGVLIAEAADTEGNVFGLRRD